MSTIDWKQVPGIGFWPWVGKEYPEQDKRLLVLGESHYDRNGDDSPDYTKIQVQEHLEHLDGKRLPFLTKTARVISWGTPLSGDPCSVWQSIAFYNYIPRLVGTKSRMQPSQQQWEDAKSPFLRVVEMLRPSHVLVLGISQGRLWDHAKSNGIEGPVITVNGQERRSARVGDDMIPMLPIQHPSTAFSYKAWAPWVAALRNLQ